MEFGLLRLPGDLIKYILTFIDPDQFHNLYRVCKKINDIVSSKNFLIDKLVWDLGEDKTELESLFDLDSSIHKLTSYLRYVRTLAFYNKIIRASTAWLTQKQCVKGVIKLKNRALLKYFAGAGNIEHLLGEKYIPQNIYKCSKRHISGESVKCEDYEMEYLQQYFKLAAQISKGKLPEDHIKEAQRYPLLKLAIKIGKYKLAYELAKKYQFTNVLENLVFDELVKTENIEALKKSRYDAGNNSKIIKSRNYEFIVEYLKLFPNGMLPTGETYWTPEFAKAFFEPQKSSYKWPCFKVPARYLVKYKDIITNYKVDPESILAIDIFKTIYRRERRIRKCHCGRVPLKAKICADECETILMCNFCNKLKGAIVCKICKLAYYKRCNVDYVCRCGEHFICTLCNRNKCDGCRHNLCKSCQKVCKRCGFKTCPFCSDRKHRCL